jgi:hypothetical protein
MKRNASRWKTGLCAAPLLAVAAVGFAAPSSPVRTLTDPFNRLSPAVWTVTATPSGPRAGVSQGRLEIAFAPDVSGPVSMAKVECKARIHGDFDARVDYQLLEWPPAGGVKLSLGTEEGSIQRAGDPNQGGEVYLTHFAADAIAGQTPTADMAGSLRLVRRGNVLTGYALRNGQWAPVHTATLASRVPVRLHLAAWSHDSIFSRKPVRVAFDNFRLRYHQRRPTARTR